MYIEWLPAYPHSLAHLVNYHFPDKSLGLVVRMAGTKTVGNFRNISGLPRGGFHRPITEKQARSRLGDEGKRGFSVRVCEVRAIRHICLGLPTARERALRRRGLFQLSWMVVVIHHDYQQDGETFPLVPFSKFHHNLTD